MPTKPSVAFSNQLQAWLKSDKPKTIAGLIEVSDEKSFAVLFLVLMAIPALPIPTGGITHIFEIIVALLALELIIGRHSVWLPQKWLNRKLGKTLEKRGLPYLIKKIHWLEKYARPRWSGILQNTNYLRLIGLIVLVLTAAAFISPPFSGLDTVPSLGIVGISLGIILDDFVVVSLGIIIGALGIVIEIGLGAFMANLLQRLF